MRHLAFLFMGSILLAPACGASSSFDTANGVSATTNTKHVGTLIAAGEDHTCAVRADSTVRCWGLNILGDLGNGNSTSSSVPVTVSGITNAVAVAAGWDDTCALESDDNVQCWGWVDDLKYDVANMPVTVSSIGNTTSVAAGCSYECVTLTGGTVQCWGFNTDGELGNGTTTDSSLPVTVSGITNATAIAAGCSHTCVVLSSGLVQCWGWNGNGVLGNGTTATNSPLPVTVSGITNAVAVASSWNNSCALLNDGTVHCWGWNGNGELGNGTRTIGTLPETVSGITDAVAIATGFSHSCAVLKGGAIQCWGFNNYGEIGNGTTLTINPLPVAVTGITNAIAVAAGSHHTCAMLNDNTVQCWGLNHDGQLGNGTTTDSNVPVTVTGF